MTNPKLLRLRWADAITSTPKKTADFYSELLGFAQVPFDEGDGHTSYCLCDEEGKEIFGVVDDVHFQDWASGWVLYFEVDDYEEQCKKAVKLGATIISKSENPMRGCLLKDPSGSPIAISPAKKQLNTPE